MSARAGTSPSPAPGSAVDVLGVPVHPVRVDGLLARVAAGVANRHRTTIMYLNIHVVNSSVRDPALGAALRQADLVYCDGAGVRLGARLLGHDLPQRMTGADLLWEFAADAGRRGLRLFWIGGAEGVAALALERMRERHPGLVIAGSHHGFFDRDGPGGLAVLAAVRLARPDVLLVGLGTPAQERWVARHRDALQAPVVWCVGAAADFVSGRVRRAPAWMHRHGLEWAFRLLLEPRRMFMRYVVGNPLFFARVLARRLRAR